MTTNLTTRKPLRKLTRADMQAFSIWEWAINEEGIEAQDESVVRPTTHAVIPVDGFGQFVVAATAQLRDKTSMPALVEVTVNGKQRSCEPLAVFLLDRHLDFVGVESTRLLSRFTQTVNNHPVRWQLAVAISDEKKLRGAKVRRSAAYRLVALVWRLKFEKARRGALGWHN